MLSVEQERLVRHPGGPLLIVAAAGSGKTRVLTHRIGWLVAEGVPPPSIWVATFTNRAAEEIRERLVTALGGPATFGLQLGTLHALAARLLRECGPLGGFDSRFTILDPTAAATLLARVLAAERVPRERLSAGAALARITHLKENGIGPEQFRAEVGDGWVEEPLSRVYLAYQELLVKEGKADFADLIGRANRLLARVPTLPRQLEVRHLLVDEFQDIASDQFQLICGLVAQGADLTVVGDPDQSIYRWRGATPEILLGFGRDYMPGGTIAFLSRNWRSTEPIVSAARHVITRNGGRLAHPIEGDRGRVGPPVTVWETRNAEEETAAAVTLVEGALAAWPAGEVALLARTNLQLYPVAQALRARGIAVQLQDGSGEQPTAAGAVTLATVHAAKGCEWKVVGVLGCEEGLMPHLRAATQLTLAAVEEERCLFYVAMTRAKHRLWLLWARQRSAGRGKAERRYPSRFLMELPQEQVVWTKGEA